MQYKHSVWFLSNKESIKSFCSRFIKDNKLICNNIIPAPADAAPAWKRAQWGIVDDEIPVEMTGDGFSFECDSNKMLNLMVEISKLDPKMDFTYKFASSELGTSVGNYNITCGRVMMEKKVSNPAMFACALWGLDYTSYVTRRKFKSRINADEVRKVVDFVNGDELEFTDIDNILAEEDD